MTPGLARGPPFPEKAKKGSVVAVAGLEKESVPVWVGVCEIDVSDLGEVHGTKGRAVKGVHWAGDELWTWHPGGLGGRAASAKIEGWIDEKAESAVADGVEELKLDKEDDDEDELDDGGGVSLEVNAGAEQDGQTESAPTKENLLDEPSTREIDQAFLNAFLYSICNAKKHGTPPQYGIKFPIQPGILISSMIQPYMPIYHDSQAQHYSMKKTSWKNTKKFIKHLDKVKLVKSKERSGHETVILDIDFEDQQVLDFIPYPLPKAKEPGNGDPGGPTGGQSASSSADPSLGQSLSIQPLLRPSAKLVPNLLPSKTDFYTPAEVSAFLKKYIESDSSLTTGTSSPRFIKLDPFLSNNVLGSNPDPADTKALAASEIARDVLLKRIVEDSTLCAPFWVLLRGEQEWSSSGSSSLPKPKPNPQPRVLVTIEKRTGTKVGTKVSGLEPFGISPDVLAGELQKKCAGSTSVGQLVGGKPGMMEVLVQGDHRGVVENEVKRRGVLKGWIEVVDKVKKKTAGNGGGGGGKR